jgi:thioredoxin reductase (NADPH)
MSDLNKAPATRGETNHGAKDFMKNSSGVGSIAFPVLNKEQIAQLANCATISLKRYRDGETLIAVGDRSFKFFIVKSGNIDIVDCSGDAPKTIAVPGKGEFTGDISHLTGTPAIFTAIARGDCEVIEVSGGGSAACVESVSGSKRHHPAGLYRAPAVTARIANFIGLRASGSRYSPDTFRVRDFLARNRVLFTWIDLESDPNVDRVLKDFGLTEADTPVVACAPMLVLRNPSNDALANEVGIRQRAGANRF